MDTRILVTGGAGFIGSHLIDLLLDKGCSVKALVRNETAININPKPNLEFIYGDIKDRENLPKAVEGIDAVFHLAGAVGSSRHDERDLFDTNVYGTENMLWASRDRGIKRFIYCSSVGVLGHIENPPAAEDYPYNPSDPYEMSKCEGEKIALRYASDRMDVVVVRPAWVYGPRDRRTLKLFQAIKKKRFFIMGDGKTLEHPVFVTDLVEGLHLCLENRAKRGEIFHIGGDEIVTIEEMCGIIAELLGVRIPKIHVPVFLAKGIGYLSDAAFRVFDKKSPITPSKVGFFLKDRAYSIAKAKAVLGFTPRVSLREGLRKTVEWYKREGYL